MTVSIIIPILNEPRISDFLNELHDVMAEMLCAYEVIVVWGDRETLYPKVPQLPNQKIVKSFGDSLERAILTGFSHTSGNRIIVMDADGSHPIYELPNFIKGFAEYEMVVGSRYLDDSEYEYSRFRKLVAWCFKKYAHLLGSKLSDPMSGFFGVKREVIEKIEFRPFTWKTGLEIELKASPSILEIPINFNKRQAGLSKANAKTGIKIILDMLLG